MIDILNRASATSLDALGLAGKEARAQGRSTDLGQDDFLTLLTTQLQNQDPMQPMDNGQFLGQMAQFSTVNGLEKLNLAFEQLASSLTSNQALQASGLVGRRVLISGNVGTLVPGEGMSGAVDLSAQVPDLALGVYDLSGQLVRQMPMAGQGPGLVNFKWDGFGDEGQALPAGRYLMSVEGTLDGKYQRFETFALAPVESVSLSGEGQGLLLNLAGLGQVPFDEVREIR